MSCLSPCTCACCTCGPGKAEPLLYGRAERQVICFPMLRMVVTAEWTLSAQCAAGTRGHEKELRLFEALDRMPARHRSVSALALVRALTLAPDVRHLGRGLRYVLVVSIIHFKFAHLKLSDRPCKRR